MTKPKNSNVPNTKPVENPKSGLAKTISSTGFAKLYAAASVAVLAATTILWSILSANLQRANADQLVNSFLFQGAKTFHYALLPGQHTFLLKWPLFLLVKAFGSTATTFMFFTVAVVLVTVAALVSVMYLIEKRLLVFGTLCLALASVLLLIPAQPYAGGLLPVNMAMLATRNIEYVVYIVSLAILVRWPKIHSLGFWVAAAALSVLIASDKLFLTLSLAGALGALVVYATLQGWKVVSLAVRWLIASLVAGAGAFVILWIVSLTKITHIASQSSAGPYGLATGVREIGLGVIYAFLGLLTNFGANPAYDATVVRNIPHEALHNLLSLGGITYLINGLILVVGLFIVYRLMRVTLAGGKQQGQAPDRAHSLSIMLIWTTAASFVAFIVSNHYYAVDARYLTISLFAVFVAAATWTRKQSLQPKQLVIAGSVIVVGVVLGLTTVMHTYTKNQAALKPVTDNNALLVQILQQHPVDILVGDYWRVIPTKLAAGGDLNVMPLSACTQARDTLSSGVWQPNLQTHSFAYLLSFDKSLTDYPRCTINQVIASYGRPNSSTVVSGSLKSPKELLLFYDNGIRKVATPPPPQGPSTIVPISLDQLTQTVCSVPTDMNVVAHQDDDLLFMNPDIMHSITAGHCVRTVYVTAGDGGAGKFYWLSREQGSEAAYDAMDGSTPDVWIQKIVELSNHQFVTIASPKGNTKLSLIFMNLPDGNLKGEGFASSHFQSLAKLDDGQVKSMQTVDGQSTYTSADLTAGLTSLMHTYLPSDIRTQANYVSHEFPDHSDHMAVGRYIKKAYKQYEDQQYSDAVTIPLKFYVGYPVHAMAQNVYGADLVQKEAVFLDYAKFDGGVCKTIQLCQQTPTYGSYLARQYQNAY